MPIVIDYTDQELHCIREFLTSHYAKEVEIQLADCEWVLTPKPAESTAESTICRTVLWHEQGANFVIFKTGVGTYRARFFYTPREQFSTDSVEFTHLQTCLAEVLETRKHHHRGTE